MYVSMFFGSQLIEKFSQIGEIGNNHYYVLFRGLVGEKMEMGLEEFLNQSSLSCPSMSQLNDTNLNHSTREYLFRNRNIDTLNIVFGNHFEMNKDLGIYLYFLKRYIFDKVFEWFWVPIFCA